MRNRVLVSRWWLIALLRSVFVGLIWAVRSSRAVRGRFGWGRLHGVFGALVVLLCAAVAATPANAFVYWAGQEQDRQAIARANLDGTGVKNGFITGVKDPWGVAVDGQHIYWTDDNGTTIARANLDGTGVDRSFITGTDSIGVAVDSHYVYWTNATAGTIGRADLDGTGVTQSFITGANDPWAVAVDGQHVYWTNYGSSTIGRANVDGTGVNQSFITGANEPSGVAVDGQHVYWIDDGAIGRANLDGTGVNESFVSGNAAQGVAVDSHYVYWANYDTTIGRANLDGTGVNQSFITGVRGPFGLAVDSLTQPSVTGVSPNVGPTGGGTSVTITGANLGSGATVSFGGVPASKVNVVSSTQLQATAPAQSAGAVHVTVMHGAASATSAEDLYAYGPPSTGSFTPSSGITGTAVTITGTGFVPGVKVGFGALASPSVTIQSGTQLRAVVPNGAVPATVSVSDAQGSATSTTRFTPTLSLTGFSPTSGPAGTLITIDGIGFNASSTVEFQAIAASSVTFVSPSELQVRVPAGPRGETIIKVANTTAAIGTVKSAANFRVTR